LASAVNTPGGAGWATGGTSGNNRRDVADPVRRNSSLDLADGLIGERAGTRTQDLLIKSQLLYRLSYALVTKA
jgi:hypothetical protein